jgi:uncharacterized damage-inducible protein DinB
MRAEDAKTIADFLVSAMEGEVQATTAVLSAVPADRLDFRPDAKSKSALGLARHITLEDEWFLDMVAQGQFLPPPDDSDACGMMTPKDAAARYSDRIPKGLARIRALSGEHLAREIDMFGGMMRMPVVGVLSLAVRHSTHHRGQLSSYLRPMGGKVPSIYGPSADTQQQPVAV